MNNKIKSKIKIHNVVVYELTDGKMSKILHNNIYFSKEEAKKITKKLKKTIDTSTRCVRMLSLGLEQFLTMLQNQVDFLQNKE